MSQLDIKIRKLQDNGSTFRANMETLYLGGVRSADESGKIRIGKIGRAHV